MVRVKKTDIMLLCLFLALMISACRDPQVAEQTATNSETGTISGFGNAHRYLMDTEDGHIIVPLLNSEYIYYWNTKEKICVPLCNKPDCDHMGRDCNAYIPDAQPYSLQFYDGKYYIWTTGGSPRLYAVEPDGSGSSLIMISPTGGGVRNSFIIEDYCYVHVAFAQDSNGSDVDAIYRIDMNQKESPVLIAVNNDNTDWLEHRMMTIFYQDHKLYYQITEYNPGECRSRVFCYNEETETTEQLLEVPHVISYVVVGEKIIYSLVDCEPAELYCKSLDREESIKIDQEGGYLSSDDTYYYITSTSDNPVSCRVLDRQFQQVDCFTEQQPASIDFIARGTTNSSIIFNFEKMQEAPDGESDPLYQDVYRVYSKEQIGKEEHQYDELVLDMILPE